MAELKIVSVGDLPWQEVKAQAHPGGRRVSVWEKFLEWSPERMVIYARYDPGMVVERHGHASDHFVYVVAGEVLVGDRPCPAGTHLTLEHGAQFGPLVAGPEGATLYEVMTGDPRAVPADPEGFAELLASRGIEPLPNPPVPWPDWLAPRTDHQAGLRENDGQAGLAVDND
ncbi:hypothetical protein I6A60_39540 [Frankia sp. AgB1.9]|uniref:cupin domain-containing protein n=1 Tax=unclassified Frankia TaxID=2632575 RepID=UPI0019346AD0|nr:MULTISPECIES: hypothetical protein [unclassified Frankia]MBL7491849.1 hypothetical protein [Frankia sp. AgW1.1]MBL7553879.1 hypothetical protein [Frankia sp. AgB1.9]MBL7618031.1 hypothetical protein [Frankia sp. AgB1.8]